MKLFFQRPICFIIIIHSALSLSLDDLRDYRLYINEICSYNGKPTIHPNKTVSCDCQKEFTTLNIKNKTIRNQLIQCDYQLKRRFLALFFAILFPLGFEYIYLMHYEYFVIYFLVVMILISVLISYFLISNGYSCNNKKSQVNTFSSQKDKSDKRKESKKINQVNSEAKEIKESIDKNDNKPAYPVFQVITVLATIVLLLGWFTNIGLIASGVIRDANNQITFNDLSFLINIR